MRTSASILALVLAAAAPVAAQDARGVPRVLLDRSLQEHTVLLTGLDRGTLSYAENGLVRTEPLSEYLAILPAPSAPAQRPGDVLVAAPQPAGQVYAAPGMTLELVDGQRLAGQLGTEAPVGDTFTWSHPLLGSLQLRMDDVRQLRLHSSTHAIAAGQTGDVVLLANGDRLQGFVESLADPLVLSVGEQQHQIPLERVGVVAFANPPAERAGSYVWLKDGSIVAVRTMRTTRMGELQLSPRLASESESSEGKVASMPLGELDAVNLDVRALVPLASLEPRQQEPVGERRWSEPMQFLGGPGAPLGASDILMPGPMEVSWTLPPEVVRLATTAELPRESWTWGDCELVIELRGAGGAAIEIERQRLNADRPLVSISADLPASAGRTLVLRLEPGEYGPVQDRVILRRPLLASPQR